MFSSSVFQKNKLQLLITIISNRKPALFTSIQTLPGIIHLLHIYEASKVSQDIVITFILQDIGIESVFTAEKLSFKFLTSSHIFTVNFKTSKPLLII